jgi:catechol 2,3-dioxygenase-like lactoylglutathione lyase family enzyme
MLGISKALLAGILGLAMVYATAALADDQRTPAPEGAEVYFITPGNGHTVKSPVTIQFGLRGMGVAPAGTERENTGHHHLLINTKLEDYAQPIPSDEQHVHFGGGQTEVTLDLPKGTHTLQLVLGDQNHVPHATPVESKVITITVQ